MGLAGGQPAKHICDGDPHLPYARAAAALAGFDRDDVMVIHSTTIASFSCGRSSVCPVAAGVTHAMAGVFAAASAQGAVRSVHGDWQIRCDTPPGAQAEQCALIQS